MLSEKVRKILIVAMANKAAAKELADAVDNGGNPKAATVAAIPASADLSVPAVAAVIEPITMADVKAALDVKADNADVVTLVSEVEARMDTVEGKINAVIAALKAAGLMA